MSTRDKAVIIMAAGKGTRMRSKLTKVLHPVAGRPMIHYPIRTALELGAQRIVVVLGYQFEQVDEYLKTAFPDAPIQTVLQAEQLGTAHAVSCAEPALRDFQGDIFILSGDVPTLPTEVVQRLDIERRDCAVNVLGMTLTDPGAYGRLVIGTDGHLRKIVEAVDCSPEEARIPTVNAGVYRVDAEHLFATLTGLSSDNAQNEYYLTDIVEVAVAQGKTAGTTVLSGDESQLAEGVNDRAHLAAAERRMQKRICHAFMRAGVSFIDPDRVTIHDGVIIGADTVIEPGVQLRGQTTIGEGCIVEQSARIVDSAIGDGTRIRAYSHLEKATVGPGCQVGPFARLREGTRLHAEVKIGNFVETKKAEFGAGAKANHLAYVGDASVGAQANLGAGTITCNYDGFRKFRTEIGDGAFIGSDTQLVAPVRVGDGALVGAGSTITEDVPDNALALSRHPQKNVPEWAARRRKKLSKSE
ncbi:MAG: bifunctional UDP-N-acetylglucosamine diphosphorylase/glucosamine-1-phosphate N-acetyltransferase GlmU [Myxococcota bacterium]|nr:bifunctional UDP-N-acetylglucosamine diphosphorylase/glucosamine-1-phosphate N-acetyltransferase GlmU [Myxococcota bacterium]